MSLLSRYLTEGKSVDVSGLSAPGRDRHPEAGGEDEVREPGGGAGGLLSPEQQ